MMRVLVYYNAKTDAGKRLRRVIEATPLKSRVEYHETISGLIDTLTRPANAWGISVLLPTNREDLEQLTAIGEFLKTLRIILVLPDNSRDTISKGHALSPRCLMFAHGCLENVGAVLKKMTASFGLHPPFS